MGTRKATREKGLNDKAIALPAGQFLMGSPASESGRFDDEGQKPVRVTAFAVAKFPVTRGQWRANASRADRRHGERSVDTRGSVVLVCVAIVASWVPGVACGRA